MDVITDYPAAHSMDTTWFAVDRDGHVGVFSSGEAGAVPLAAFGGEGAHQAAEELARLFPVRSVVFDPVGRCLPTEITDGAPLDRAYLGVDYPILLFLSSLEPVQEALASGVATAFQATEGEAVVFPRLREEDLNLYRTLPEFIGCLTFFVNDPRFPGGLAHRGLYEYGHLTENWISGPYGRETLPACPLHVDQLPPQLREQFSQFRLEQVRFSEWRYLQPVELTECASWEAAYVDLTCRQIRPIPGREEEYAEAYLELVDLGEAGFQIEPPQA